MPPLYIGVYHIEFKGEICMYRVEFVDDTVEYIDKRVWRGYWIANRERIRGYR